MPQRLKPKQVSRKDQRRQSRLDLRQSAIRKSLAENREKRQGYSFTTPILSKSINVPAPPVFISVISLGKGTDPVAVTQAFNSFADSSFFNNSQGPLTMNFKRSEFPKSKGQRYTFYVPPRKLFPIIESALCSDVIIFLIDALESEDPLGDIILQSLECQGFPTVVGMVQNLSKIPKTQKKTISNWYKRYLNTVFARAPVPILLENAADPDKIRKFIVQLQTIKLVPLSFREGRSYLFTDSWEWKPTGSLRIPNYNDENSQQESLINKIVHSKNNIVDMSKNKDSGVSSSNAFDQHSTTVLDFSDEEEDGENGESNHVPEASTSESNITKTSLLNSHELHSERINTNNSPLHYSFTPLANGLFNTSNYSPENQSIDVGSFSFTGFLNGFPLNSDTLINLPGFGDFHISKIEILSPDPLSETTKPTESRSDFVPVGPPKTHTPVVTFTDIDPVAVIDQSVPWQHMLHFEHKDENSTAIMLPSIIDQQILEKKHSIEESEDEEEEEDDNDDFDEETSEVNDTSTNITTYMDEDDDYHLLTPEKLEIVRNKLFKEFIGWEAGQDAEFPDEVEVPPTISAQLLYGDYVGLKSWRTSPWHPQLNLPSTYSKIFRFSDVYSVVDKKVHQELESSFEQAQSTFIEGKSVGGNVSWALPGHYVKITLSNVPRYVLTETFGPAITAGTIGQTPLIISSLLPFEEKVSVLNFDISRCETVIGDRPLPSRDSFWFFYGFRKIRARPIFSRHLDRGCSKHKYEPFFHTAKQNIYHRIMATIFAPMQFGKCHVLVFSSNLDVNTISSGNNLKPDFGENSLIATGQFIDTNPDRLIIQRIMLSGDPRRVRNKYSFIRHMFYNPDDVKFFKTIELTTKHGKNGQIIGPRGLTGLFKAKFESKLRSEDTVLLKLYKRIYPLWPLQNDDGTPKYLWNLMLSPAEKNRRLAAVAAFAMSNSRKYPEFKGNVASPDEN